MQRQKSGEDEPIHKSDPMMKEKSQHQQQQQLQHQQPHQLQQQPQQRQQQHKHLPDLKATNILQVINPVLCCFCFGCIIVDIVASEILTAIKLFSEHCPFTRERIINRSHDSKR